MKVVYRERRSSRTSIKPLDSGDVIELLRNDWDDYGNQTTFEIITRLDGRVLDLGSIRLLVEGKTNSANALAQLIAADWSGEFPLPDTSYVSVPSDISFYEQIVSIAGLDQALQVAEALRDASLLVYRQNDDDAARLSKSTPFKNSLLRERASTKAFTDGWKVFSRQSMSVLDLGFKFEDVFGDTSMLELKFEPDGPLPRDINILIGPNGVGKSQILHQMVEDWISDKRRRGPNGFVKKPNLSQIVVVSYSPFERFPLDLEDKNLRDKDVYRYFGFRAWTVDRKGIGLSRRAPERDAANSLLSCAADDLRFASIESWATKLATAEDVLRTAFSFEQMAVRVSRRRDPDEYVNGSAEDTVVDIGEERFVTIGSENMSELCLEHIRADLIARDGVIFLQDGDIVELSSGQKLFSFIVLNILGALRRDSLVLIDEPELFLHPALEIRFIDMLKQILSNFNSKALLSTHSEVTVREVPSACVHVLARTDDGLVISKPPFQTFGGDIQRISSYVFGDDKVRKPFEEWIRTQLQAYGDAESLLAALGPDANEELIVQIRAIDGLRKRRAVR